MDFKSLGENLGLEENEFLEIVELFVNTANNDSERMKKAIVENNTKELTEAAHSLKGAAGNLGFSEISSNAEIIEKAARDGKCSGFDQQLSVIEERLAEIKLKTGL